MEEISAEYYRSLFTTNNFTEFTELLDVVQQKVSTAMNYQLTRDFNAMEVKAALNQMYPLKALGLDGMPPLFF